MTARADAPVEARLLEEDDGPDLRERSLPPRLRPAAELGVLDVSEYFAATSGGVRTYLLEKARYVEARPGLRHVIAVPGRTDSIASTEGVRCYRLHGPLIPLQSTYRFLLATRSLRRIVEHERPDVIEVGSNYFVPWVVRLCTRRRRVPTVWFYHAHLPRIAAPRLEAEPWPRRWLGRLFWRYVRWIAGTVDEVFVASDFIRDELAAHGITHTRRVPLGVDLQTFHPQHRMRRDATRARFGLPTGPLALFAGRFSIDKDLVTLFRGWAEVRRRTGMALAMVGDGHARGVLEPLARDLGLAVHWVPFVTDREALADLLASAELYLAPSPTETFGLAAHEAMASGRAVLSCDVGAVAEVVARSGVGARYRTGDPASLVVEALALLERDLEALGAEARAYVETHHAWDTVFDGLVGAYRDLAAS